MSQSPKRDPLSGAPTSRDIMTGARRRQANQNAGIPASNNTSIMSHQQAGKEAHQRDSMPAKRLTGTPEHQLDSTPLKRKSTFYLPIDLQKAIRKAAFVAETNQSQLVEDAVKEYLDRRPSGGTV